MPVSSDNYLKQFLSWLLSFVKQEKRGNTRANPIAESIRNPREGSVVFPILYRINRDTAGRDCPIATYKAVANADLYDWDCWFICDRISRGTTTQEITVGQGLHQLRVRVLDESGSHGADLGIASHNHKQPTHRIAIFELSRYPDSHGIYNIQRRYIGYLNLVNSFMLYDSLATRLTKILAKKVFNSFPGSIQWDKWVDFELWALSQGYTEAEQVLKMLAPEEQIKLLKRFGIEM